MADKPLVLTEAIVRRIAAAVRAYEREPKAERTGRYKKRPIMSGGGFGVRFILGQDLFPGEEAIATPQQRIDGQWQNLPPEFFGVDDWKVLEGEILTPDLYAPAGTLGIAIKALQNTWLVVALECDKLLPLPGS